MISKSRKKLDALKGWWHDNGRTVIGAVVACVAAILAVQGWRYYQQTQAVDAATLYGRAAGSGADKGREEGTGRHRRDVQGALTAHERGYAAMAALPRRTRASPPAISRRQGQPPLGRRTRADEDTRATRRCGSPCAAGRQALRRGPAGAWRRPPNRSPVVRRRGRRRLRRPRQEGGSTTAYQTVLDKLPSRALRNVVELKRDALGYAAGMRRVRRLRAAHSARRAPCRCSGSADPKPTDRKNFTRRLPSRSPGKPRG